MVPSTMRWIVYLDNIYTTVPLLGRLHHTVHMRAGGNACSFLAEFPPEHNIPKQDVGKYEYHALKVLAIEINLFGQLICAHLWFDIALVPILSAVHDFETQPERLKMCRPKNHTIAKKARRNFCN